MNSELIKIIEKIGATELLVEVDESKIIQTLNTKYRRKLMANKINLSNINFDKKVPIITEVVSYGLPEVNPLSTSLPPALNYLNIKPFDHQCQAFNFWLNQENRRCIIADEMGLGKTITALMIAKYMSIETVVICPASLKSVWQKEAEKIAVTVKTFSYEKCPSKSDYEKFHDYLVIVDEAHYIQNHKSIRARKVFDLTQDATGVLLLTGTPMRNGRPINMFPLLRIIEHPIAQDKRLYERQYCDAKKTNFSQWDTTGASNLLEFKSRISNKLIQRKKDDCIDLPDKIYTYIDAIPTKKEWDKYYEDLKNLQEEFECKSSISRMDEATGLILMNHLRTSNSMLKAGWVMKYLEENFADDAVVVFSPFVPIIELLASHFDVSPFTGNTPLKLREKIVEDFQNGKTNKFFGTIGSGGVGVTLHRASHLVMIDPPWTPGDYHQATDRIHRIGQKNVCNIYNIKCCEVDNYVYKMINRKEGIIRESIPILQALLYGK